VDLLEAKNAENEAKIREQDKEIDELKTKIDTIQLEPHHISKPLANGGIFPAQPAPIENKMMVRELSLIGHSLDGLYLLKNPNTKKIETVFCDFGESS